MSSENTTEHEYWLTRVKQNGGELKDVPPDFVTEEMCHIAVAHRGLTLQYVPEKFKSEALFLKAIQQNGYSLGSVPDEIKTQSMCLAAMQDDGEAFGFAPKELKTKEIWEIALGRGGCYLEVLPDTFKCLELYKIAVQQNGEALEFIDLPADNILLDIQQINDWNSLLGHANNIDSESRENVHKRLLDPMIQQMKEAISISSEMRDAIQQLIEQAERLEIHIDPIKQLFIEQGLSKKASKHQRSSVPSL